MTKVVLDEGFIKYYKVENPHIVISNAFYPLNPKHELSSRIKLKSCLNDQANKLDSLLQEVCMNQPLIHTPCRSESSHICFVC